MYSLIRCWCQSFGHWITQYFRDGARQEAGGVIENQVKIRRRLVFPYLLLCSHGYDRFSIRSPGGVVCRFPSFSGTHSFSLAASACLPVFGCCGVDRRGMSACLSEPRSDPFVRTSGLSGRCWENPEKFLRSPSLWLKSPSAPRYRASLARGIAFFSIAFYLPSTLYRLV